jgi:MFS family permease
LLPLILIIFLLSRWSGALVPRYGAKIPLIIGPLIAAGGFALFVLPGVGGNYWQTFFPAVIVLGIGMALSVAPLTTTVMSSVAGDRAGVASGINNAVSRTAGLLAIAVLGIVILHSFDRSLDDRLAKLNLSPSVKQSLDAQRNKLAGAELPESIPAPTRELMTDAIKRSFVDGFRAVMLTGAALALGSAITALLLISAAGKTTRRSSLSSPPTQPG